MSFIVFCLLPLVGGVVEWCFVVISPYNMLQICFKHVCVSAFKTFPYFLSSFMSKTLKWRMFMFLFVT